MDSGGRVGFDGRFGSVGFRKKPLPLQIARDLLTEMCRPHLLVQDRNAPQQLGGRCRGIHSQRLVCGNQDPSIHLRIPAAHRRRIRPK